MRKMLLLAVALVLVGLNAKAVDFDTRACVTPNSEIFVSGMQRWVRMKDKDRNERGADKTRFTPTATAIGYQYNTQNWSAGLSVSYETGNLKYDWNPDEYVKVRDRTLGFTLFGKYTFGEGYYAKGSAFLGFASQKVKNGYVGTDSYNSNGTAHSTRFGASLEFGKVYELCSGLRLTPHVGFDYAYVPGKDIGYRVNGAGSFDSDWPSQNTYEIPLGVTLARDFAVGCDWVLTPSIDATLISSVGHIKGRNMNSRPGFASRTGSEWKVYDINGGHWGGRVTAGLKAVKAEKFDVDVNYAYEGRKKYSDHRLTASLGFKF